MIDVHCHLNLHKFDTDYDQVIKDALAAGVTKIVNTGTSIPSSRKAVELASKYENLYAIVGIHPHHADKTDKEFEGELQTDWLKELESLAKMSKVIGIGEVGMDYFQQLRKDFHILMQAQLPYDLRGCLSLYLQF
jgi:TatD DNase family protein